MNGAFGVCVFVAHFTNLDIQIMDLFLANQARKLNVT